MKAVVKAILPENVQEVQQFLGLCNFFHTHALITDASLGVAEKPGGLGAILTQIDKKGDHHVVAYASRKLQKHEANYTPFLLEMQAALWGMDHYDTYLREPFILFTNH